MTHPGSEIRILLLLGVAALAAFLSHAVFAEGESPAENVDHAGIISKWDSQSFERGRKLFMIACAPCHGTNGVQTINPQSRPFAVEKFHNGSDPYSIFRTITGGFKTCPPRSG